MHKRLLVLFLCLLLFALPIPMAQAAGCVVVDTSVDGNEYANFGGGDYLIGSISLYSDSACQDYLYGSNHPRGIVYASSSDAAAAICASIHGDSTATAGRGDASNIYGCRVNEQPTTPTEKDEWLLSFSVPDPISSSEALRRCRANHPRANYVREVVPNYWVCWFVGKGSSRRSGAGSFRSASRACAHTLNLPLDGLRLHAFDGMNSGIQFRRLDNCGIGDPNVIDMGFIDAVDVWSNVGSGFSVCFPQAGRIVFLDAATSPRTLMEIDYHVADGETCASMDRAGTMVLVETPAGKTTTATTPATTRRPGTDDSVEDAVELQDCSVIPRVNLRLRAAPWGKILAVIRRETEVPALARTKSWFNVTYEETTGWSAAWLADRAGECDWQS